MRDFRRYLLVTDRNGRIAQADCEVDIVSWDSLKSIVNAADYDGWILNTTALRNRVPLKLFTAEEIQVLFDYQVLGHVVDGSGRVFIIGDFKKAFYTAPAADAGRSKKETRSEGQPFQPFEKILNVERDPRPIDYRRVSRPFDYNYKAIYAYLDQVSTWDYSLKFKRDDKAKVFEHVELGTTNFDTCLAADFSLGSGHLFLLPSLGTTVEEEDRYVLKHFFGVGMQASAPAWANKLAVPEQKLMEETLSQKRESLEALVAEIKAQAKELANLQRWKRLLYDDGVGLEEIVKESFELLSAKVVKKTPEKDDYRLEVSGHSPCELSEWMDHTTSEDLVAVKGAFVGNASRENEPSSRGSMFDSNNIDYAKLKQMVLMRSMDLYCVVLLALVGMLNVEKFWAKFFDCSGEFDAAEFWDGLPQEFRLSSTGEPQSTSGGANRETVPS